MYIYIYRRQSSKMHIDVMTCDDHVVSTSGLNNITLSTTCPPVGNCTCHVILGVAWSISPGSQKDLLEDPTMIQTVVNGSTQWSKRNFERQTLVVTYATSTPNHNLRKAPTNRSECHESFRKSPRFTKPTTAFVISPINWFCEESWSPQTIQTISWTANLNINWETAKVDIPDSPCRRHVECLQLV